MKRKRPYRAKYTLGTIHHERREKLIPNADMFAERDQRKAAILRMSDVDLFLGVPPPGFSALDRK